jgi:addiction module HigA family antidote
MIRIPTDRPPTHPGEMLLEELLIPMQVTQRELANAIHVPYQRINEIINGRRGITPATALRLAKFFGMTPEFWMNMQLRWDLYHAQLSEKDELRAIRRHIPVSSSKRKPRAQQRHAVGHQTTRG